MNFEKEGKDMSTTGGTMNVESLEDPSSGLVRAVANAARFAAVSTLLVSHRKRGIQFHVLRGSGDWWLSGETEIDSDGVMESIQDLIVAVAQVRFADERAEDQWINLESECRSLFNRLIPEKIRDYLRALPNDSAVWLAYDRKQDMKPIPWEIMHDGVAHIGSRLQIFRLFAPTDAPIVAPYPGAPISGGPVTALNVLGGGVDESYANCFPKGCSVETLKVPAVAELLSKAHGVQVLHLTCHGFPTHMQISATPGEEFGLRIATVQNGSFGFSPNALVFANACHSGAATHKLSASVDFAEAFYCRGASVFISCLSAVPAETAHAFALAFYESLRKSGDAMLAFTEAKGKMRDSNKHRLHVLYTANAKQTESRLWE